MQQHAQKWNVSRSEPAHATGATKPHCGGRRHEASAKLAPVHRQSATHRRRGTPTPPSLPALQPRARAAQGSHPGELAAAHVPQPPPPPAEAAGVLVAGTTEAAWAVPHEPQALSDTPAGSALAAGVPVAVEAPPAPQPLGPECACVAAPPAPHPLEADGGAEVPAL